MNSHKTALLVIAPWQARLYTALATPPTLALALASVDRVAAHRDELQARGDEAAAAGVAAALRLTVIQLASVEAQCARRLARKVRVLGRHRALWIEEPLLSDLIDVAVMDEAAALGLSAPAQARLRRSLWVGR